MLNEPPANLNPKPAAPPPPPVAETPKPADAAPLPEAAEPPAGETPPEPEAAKPPEEDADAKRVGQMLMQVRRREADLVERQQRLSRGEAELARQQQERTAWQQERQRFEQFVRTDPIEFLTRSMGITREHLAERLVNGRPSPNEDLVGLKQELQAMRAEREQEKAAKAKADQQSAIDRELDAFADEAKASEKTHPHAAKYPRKKLRDMAWRIARESSAYLTNQELLGRIEDELSETAALYRGNTQEQPNPESKPKNGAENKSAGTAPAAPGAADKGNDAKPPPPLFTDPEAERAHVLAELAKLRAAKKAAANGTVKP